METRTLRVFDFDDPENNHFLAVRELWIKGPLYRRRADLIGFVNGIPLLFVELKNIHRNVRRAYDENLADYKDTIPHVFHHNAFVVLGNGVDARIGSYSAPFEYFREWKRLDEDDPGVVDMETLLKGVCHQGPTSSTCSRTSSCSTTAARGWSRWSLRTSSTSA